MDYGQAKTVLARIFKEYKAFKDLEDVIEFANLQEQRKDVLEKEITDLVTKRGSQVGDLERLTLKVSDTEKKLEYLDVSWRVKEKELIASYAALEEKLKKAFEAKKEEFFKEAARLEEAMEEAAGRLEKLNVEADAAEKRLAKAKAAYDKFKESI